MMEFGLSKVTVVGEMQEIVVYVCVRARACVVASVCVCVCVRACARVDA
jgi:hypothetical protein